MPSRTAWVSGDVSKLRSLPPPRCVILAKSSPFSESSFLSAAERGGRVFLQAKRLQSPGPQKAVPLKRSALNSGWVSAPLKAFAAPLI